MRRWLMFPLIGFLAMTASEATSPQKLSVTYVSSCGFLVQTGDAKIIIDGLLAGGDSKYYYLPSDGVVNDMCEAEAPFDQVDLILVTHAHHDHFDAEVAARHMASNPGAILIGSSQVDEKLHATDQYPQIENRVRVVPYVTDSAVQLELANDLHVKAIPIEHAPYWETDTLTGEKTNRHAAVEHLMFVEELAGKSIFHCGDAPLNDIERYQLLGFGDTTLDLAMVDWWDAKETISFGQKFIRDVIRPECAIMMHMFPDRPPRGEPDKEKIVAPRVILPDSMMQQWTID